MDSLTIVAPNRITRLKLTYRHIHAMSIFRLINEFLLISNQKAIDRFIFSKVHVDSPNILDDIKKHKGAIIFATPHYGPFIIGCLKASKEFAGNKRVYTFYDAPEKTESSAPFQKILEKVQGSIVSVFNDNAGVIKALRALRNKEIVAILPDVYDLSGQSLAVPFFNHFTQAMSGTAFLATHSKAIIVQAYCKVNWFGEVNITLEPPISPKPELSFEQNTYFLTKCIFESLERHIRQSPEYWVYLSQIKSRLEHPLADGDMYTQINKDVCTLRKGLDVPDDIQFFN